MSIKKGFLSIGLVGLFVAASYPAYSAETNGYNFKLESILAMAVDQDSWLQQSRYKEKALLSEGEAASSLPDPKASINFANFPVDDFSFNSQPMTQIKFGLSQTFGRGDSLELQRQVKEIKAKAQPYLRMNRKNQLIMQVGMIWMDAFKAQNSMQLINSKRHLFSDLSEVAEIKYTSGLAKHSQQELIRAELELVKLDDQIMVYSDKLHRSILRLSEFVQLPNSYLLGSHSETRNYVSTTLPTVVLLADQNLLQHHPLILATDKNIESAAKQIDLKQQGYKPQFTVNGYYGVRDNAPDGMERPDFFSVGINFDLPLFTDNKQDKEVKAAIYSREGKREQRTLLIKQLTAAYRVELSRLEKLNSRLKIYNEKILPQVILQGKASLNAYSNDEADFAELVRARVDEISAQLKALDIRVEIEKSKLRANYYLASNTEMMFAQIKEGTGTAAIGASTQQIIWR